MPDLSVSRRDFLLRCAALGAAGSVLSACGDSGRPTAETEAGGVCSDVSGLTPAEAQTRRTFNYVEQTPLPEKRCDNCRFWLAPAEDAACGGCTLVKGPINPGGYCTSWIAPAA